MAITEPVKVPQAKITSIDVTSFNGGLDQRGVTRITPNSFAIGRNVRVDKQGSATFRHVLKPWLPDTVDEGYEIFPARHSSGVRNITADDGKIKYISRGDSAWIDAGGDNVVTTDPGSPNTFVRSVDKVFILNGTDNLGYLDMDDMEVSHYTSVANPTTAPTATATGITTPGDFKIYFAYSYNTSVGTTAASPILTFSVNKIREMWKPDGTEYITVDRGGTPPSGAKSWNLYMATAAPNGPIQPSDLLPLAMGLDLAQPKFVDNGSLALILSAGTAPEDNSTAGPKARYGIETEGRPVLWGVEGDEYALYIGGDGEHADDFSPGNGGFRLVLNQGTNYHPMSVIGFRNGQGIPSLTVLFSNTEGLSKQMVVEQQTIEYGDISFVVWGAKEQNYGSAGVASPYGAVNYLGGLYVPSVDGFTKYDTDAGLQNVLSNIRISDPVVDEVSTIKTSKLKNIVGAAWDGRLMWTVPTRGFNYNNKILVYDLNNKDLPIWCTYDIQSQWIGTVAPEDEAGFIYVRQGKSIYRLVEGFVAHDELSNGTLAPFSMELTTGMIGSNSVQNGYYAIVQTVFSLEEFIGTAIMSVRYLDKKGKPRMKQKVERNGEYHRTSSGGWSDTHYLFNDHLDTDVEQWGDVAALSDTDTYGKKSRRVKIPMVNAITNSVQASLYLNPDSSGVKLRAISFEGKNLGVAADI